VPYTSGEWYGLLACYGDDEMTPVDEGAVPGDAIEVRMVAGAQTQVIGVGIWTAHGDRQQVPGGDPPVLPPTPPAGRLYLPLMFSGAGPDDGTPLPAPVVPPGRLYLPVTLSGARLGD